MEDKTRRLVLILETLAIITSAVLILVDYKLKNDLVDLYRKLEGTLEDGKQLFGQSFGASIDIDAVHTGNMVGPVAPVEKAASNGTAGPVGPVGTRPGPAPKRTRANRGARDGSVQISEPDKPVGS